MDYTNLLNADFNVKFINALKQFWRIENTFSCINEPKKNDLLLYVDGYSATYVDKNGNTFTANSGDIVYTPTGSEYSATINKTDENGYTIGVNFLLLSEFSKPFTLDKITIFKSRQNLGHLFEKLLLSDVFNSYLDKRIALMEIINALLSSSLRLGDDKIIQPALTRLAQNPEKVVSISDLARLCSVSEVYFRKKFRQCTGCSPVEYRNALRLEYAKTCLERDDMSIQEISDTLGYATVSHFIQQFKKRYNVSPLAYKKAHENDFRLL